MTNKFYVYVLVDPRDQAIFYVGKGCGKRNTIHYREWCNGTVSNAEKFQRIGDIIAAGMKPESIIVLDGLAEGAAYAEEKRIIAELDIRNLTNITPGKVTRGQKLVAWAKDRLTMLKPIDQWLSERDRSDFDISVYLQVMAMLQDTAAHEGPRISWI